MAHDVFICHSAKDKVTADAVCAVIESNGVRCWIAPRDVTAGMEWSECIIDAIEECRVMVLVFTTNANESPQIRREVERAVNRGVAILPLRIEDILPGRALEYFIGNVHWLDALTPPLENHLQNLAGTVKILLGRLPAHGAVVPHAEATPHATPIPHATPNLNATPNRPAIVQQPIEIPLTPRPTAPAKSEWVEPVRTPASQQVAPQTTPPERAPETSSWAAPKQTETAPMPPFQADAFKPAAPSQKRPIGIIVIPIVVFLFSAVGMIGTIHDSTNGHFYPEAGAGMALTAAGFAAAYGVITKKGWGRILQIVFSGVCAAWLMFLAQDAFRESSDGILWIFGFGFSVFAILYMFTPRVKQAFAAAAIEHQKHFSSTAAVGSAQSNISSEISARGMGPRPTGVFVVAILSFIEAGIWVLPMWDDFSRGRSKPEDFGAFLMVCAAASAGIGLIKLMGWARFLKALVAGVDALLMISSAQQAFHEGGGSEAAWIAIFIYMVWSAWYMFTPRVKQAFRKAT